MEFSYQSYWIQLFVAPSIFLFFPICLFCIASYDYWIVKGTIEKRQLINIAKYIFFVFAAIVLCTPELKNLINGGVYLLEEKETDVLWENGYVENIQEPSKRINYKETSKHAYGADIVIGGKLYFAASNENFAMDDYVRISYLPKSNLIMSMYKLSEKEVNQ